MRWGNNMHIGNRKNHIGKVFYAWTVTGYATTNSSGGSRVLAKCACGQERVVDYSSIAEGRSKSCGCRTKVEVPYE